MNWYKLAIDDNWLSKGIYHFLNAIKFEIDSFPDLSLDNNSGGSSPDRISFIILKNNGSEYNFTIKRNGNQISSIVYANPTKFVGSESYNELSSDPQQIIRDGLIMIDNNYGGELENGMV